MRRRPNRIPSRWSLAASDAGPTRRPVKLVRTALVALLMCLVAPAWVDAHSGVQSYVYVSVFDDGVQGRVEYPIGDLADVLGIELPDDPSTIDNLSEADRTAIVDYTQAHIDMRDDDGTWDLQFDGTVTYLSGGPVGYVVVPFDVAEEFDEVPRRWTVTYDGVIETNPERDALFLVEDDWRSATFRNEDQHLLGFSVGNETQTVELESASTVEALREIAQRGTVSVDRSAMVLAMLAGVAISTVLGTGPRRENDDATADRPVASWRSTLVEVATRAGLVIVGGSISVLVIGLLAADVSSRLVMATGALGVLLATTTWWLRGAAARAAVLGAGLLSGVGFGAAFVDQQLDRSAPIRSLVAFGLGMAVMVAIAVALLVPLLLVIRQSRAASKIGTVLIALVAIAGLVWLIESSFGLTFRLRTAELRAADAITSPIVVGIVTVVVALVVLMRAAAPSAASSPGQAASATDPSESDPPERVEVP